jgi:hypothetical protein
MTLIGKGGDMEFKNRVLGITPSVRKPNIRKPKEADQVQKPTAKG